jgi:hypothetical protein
MLSLENSRNLENFSEENINNYVFWEIWAGLYF